MPGNIVHLEHYAQRNALYFQGETMAMPRSWSMIA